MVFYLLNTSFSFLQSLTVRTLINNFGCFRIVDEKIGLAVANPKPPPPLPLPPMEIEPDEEPVPGASLEAPPAVSSSVKPQQMAQVDQPIPTRIFWSKFFAIVSYMLFCLGIWKMVTAM